MEINEEEEEERPLQIKRRRHEMKQH